MIRILFELLVLVIIIAIVSDDQLRGQAVELGSDLLEFVKQSVTVTYNHSKNYF